MTHMSRVNARIRFPAGAGMPQYRALAAKAGVSVEVVAELARRGDLSPLFEAGTAELRYLGTDPLRRMSNSNLRSAARHRPACPHCGIKHSANMNCRGGESRNVSPARHSTAALAICGVCGGGVPLGLKECACGAQVPSSSRSSTRTAPYHPRIEHRVTP